MARSPVPVVGAMRAAYGVLLAFPVTLFTTAVATDIAYLRTAELQWTNGSAWAIAVGLVFGAVVLILALLGVLAHLRSMRRGQRLLHIGLLAVMCALGLINAFKHSQDGWSSVGGFGLVLSILTALAALAAAAIAYSGALDGKDA